MAPLAAALRNDGWSVEAPTLPGHGTTPDDLVGVTWDEWVGAVPEARVVIGQSLGGSLALARPGTRAVVCINPVALGDAPPDGEWIHVGAPDRGVAEVAYERLPVAALREMH